MIPTLYFFMPVMPSCFHPAPSIIAKRAAGLRLVHLFLERRVLRRNHRHHFRLFFREVPGFAEVTAEIIQPARGGGMPFPVSNSRCPIAAADPKHLRAG